MTSLPTRSRVPEELTWDLDHVYPTDEAWEADVARVDAVLPGLAAHRGRLGSGASALLAFLRARDAVLEPFVKLFGFALLRAAADGTDPRNQALQARAGGLRARLVGALAFADGELLALPDGTVEDFLAAEPGLAPFRRHVEDVLRRRGHVLSADAEGLVAALGPVLNTPAVLWDRATGADLRPPPVDDGRGGTIPVTLGGWQLGLVQAADRGVRGRAYASLYDELGRRVNGLATNLAAQVQQASTLARVRGYGSAAEMLLAPRRMPLDAYRMLLEEVHEGVKPHMHRLIRLRQRVLGLDRVEMFDLAAPLDPEYEAPATFEDAERVIVAGLEPLGDEYVGMVRTAFRDRWIDRAANVGKGAGAFCSPVYGVHPYAFMNWSDTLRTVLVLAHELGHGGHHWWAARHQPVTNTVTMRLGELGGGAGILFAEAPSTVNELLVGRYLLETSADPRRRRHVVEQLLGTFTHNMVTHMLEGHFEQRLYDLADAGRPITTAAVLGTQAEVFARFFGDTVVLDDRARLYWATQPHFYLPTGLYPHTYAAGVACAVAVSERIRAEGRPAADQWLETLGLGSSLPALELARRAGVEMTEPGYLRTAAALFGELVDELDRSYPDEEAARLAST
jgi:oligoendopeptidase F